MPRPTKVWFRSDIGRWMVTVAGVKTRLVKDPDDAHHRQLAEEKFVELRELGRTRPHLPTARVADLIEAYLAWSRTHLSADTHRVNRYYGQSFAEHRGRITACDLIPNHVTKWLAEMASPERLARVTREWGESPVPIRTRGGKSWPWGESTRHNARTVAFRVFSWAEGEGLVAKLKGPKPPARKRAMTDAEFRSLYGAAGASFGDFLLDANHTRRPARAGNAAAPRAASAERPPSAVRRGADGNYQKWFLKLLLPRRECAARPVSMMC